MEILSNLDNVSKVTSAKGSTVTTGDISFQNGRNATLKAEGASFEAGFISGTSNRSTTVTVGKETVFESGNIVLGEKNDKITAGKGSEVYIGSGVSDEVFYGAAMDFGAGNDTLKAEGERFVAGEINFGNGNDTLSTGKGTTFGTLKSKTGSWEDPTDLQFADIAFGDGNDKLTTGKESIFAAGDVSSAETISLGSYSTTRFGDIEGTKKLTIGNGSAKNGGAALAAADVKGTTASDTFNFGSYNAAVLTSLDFGDGNDTLKLGTGSKVVIDESLDFGNGTKDKLSIGKGATLTVADLNVNSLETLSMSKDSVLYLSIDTQVDAAREKWSKYADQIKLA